MRGIAASLSRLHYLDSGWDEQLHFFVVVIRNDMKRICRCRLQRENNWEGKFATASGQSRVDSDAGWENGRMDRLPVNGRATQFIKGHCPDTREDPAYFLQSSRLCASHFCPSTAAVNCADSHNKECVYKGALAHANFSDIFEVWRLGFGCGCTHWKPKFPEQRKEDLGNILLL